MRDLAGEAGAWLVVGVDAARAVVVRTHTLQLPSREELEHEHLFEQLGLEKLFGRALNALIAALARHVCFADTAVLAGFVVSEAHSMTISFEGERELVDFVRAIADRRAPRVTGDDGRRALALATRVAEAIARG